MPFRFGTRRSLGLPLGGGAILKPQDVFATDLWTGDGAEKTIVNGIDLLGRGGSVWCKTRNLGQGWYQSDTARGPNRYLGSDSTSAEVSAASIGVVQFNNNGYRHDAIASPYTRVGYTFAQASRFHQVVTWTGDGTSNRLIPHGLGVPPGMIVVKARSRASTNWPVYHRSNGANAYMFLNDTGARVTGSPAYFGGVEPTATAFTLGNAGLLEHNNTGDTYVADLFAHDPSADGIVQCGSAAGDATVNLGWRPQFLMYKKSNAAGDWVILDTARGWGSGDDLLLRANTSGAEQAVDLGQPSATGFSLAEVSSSAVVYLAIRAPY